MRKPSRRTFVEGLAGAFALGGIGTATGHPSDEDHGATAGHDVHRHDATKNAERVGFHTLGGIGSESLSGQPENPLYGMLTETWLEGDLGFVAMQSTSEPTGNRGVAILDVSGYTRAESRSELEDAEMAVLSFIGNETEAGTGNDVKVSDDGRFLAYSKQAIGALYGKPASASTAVQDAPGPNVTGAEVYDITDPGNPEYVGTAQGPNAGFHNCFIHQIGGDHYLFGVQGVTPGSAGVHIYRIEDDGVVPVNFWGGEGLRSGGYGSEALGSLAGGFYCHDFYAHHDPKTGTPLGFVAYWNHGVRVLDLSNPADITELGFGKMNAAHYAQPVPALINGKRLFVGSQEHSTQTDAPSGYVNLFDADGLFDEGLTRCPKLASWTLYDNAYYVGYAFSPHNSDITEDGWITQASYHGGVRFLEIQPPGEGEVANDEWHIAGKRIDRRDEEFLSRSKLDETESFSGSASADAYGNANRDSYHRFTTPTGVEGIDVEMTWTPSAAELDLYLQENVGTAKDPKWLTVGSDVSGFPKTFAVPVAAEKLHRLKVETDYGAQVQYEISARYFELTGDVPEDEQTDVEEEALAYYRDHVGVPPESKTAGNVSPNFWSARTENGVTFGAGQHTGLYAIAADPMEVGTRTPADVGVTRTDDGSVFTAGQTNRIDYEVETDETVRIRDRLPTAWEVVGGDPATVHDTGDGTRVEFADPVEPTGDGTTSRTLFVSVKGATGSAQIGPVQFSTAADPSLGGLDWEPLPRSVGAVVVGPSQP